MAGDDQGVRKEKAIGGFDAERGGRERRLAWTCGRRGKGGIDRLVSGVLAWEEREKERGGDGMVAILSAFPRQEEGKGLRGLSVKVPYLPEAGRKKRGEGDKRYGTLSALAEGTEREGRNGPSVSGNTRGKKKKKKKKRRHFRTFFR